MLKLDLACFTDEELAAVIADRCAPLGTVSKVTVYTACAGVTTQPCAIVAMGTREAAEGVSTAFGGRTVGSAVVVFLEQLAEAVFAPVEGGMRPVTDQIAVLGKAVG
jgi:hypothetical protein